ncbi:hypothetical protein [Streptomyces sp. NBC_00038]|uniref:hypothetical protein n=1 Tax=Streptomyces sp. NBC_00038 TaxID=2903615 RepID=UPI00224E1B74|nr:hypothetical protein [Streptomyces sp. NBC_00038]MCX5554541.1 hypothetical protein [Streptomyces sp. NBC_00038]
MLVSEYVLRIPIERHVLNTRRSFTAVIQDIRETLGTSEAGIQLRRRTTAGKRARPVRRVNSTLAQVRLIGIAELEISGSWGREHGTSRLIRLLVDMPTASGDLVRFLPDAGASCPAAILVQQIADDGTRLIYDSVASAVSIYQDERSLTVARELDAEVLALLRRIANPAG